MNTDSQTQIEKMEALNRLARGVIHELNNLLTVITLNGRFLLSNIPDGELKEELQDLLKIEDRATSLIEQLSIFSVPRDIRLEKIDLAPFLETLTPDLKKILGPSVTYQQTLDNKIESVMAEKDMLRGILIELVTNAQQAMPQGGEFTLRTQITEEQTGTDLLLVAQDTGSGIEPVHLSKIFDPFFTTHRDQGQKGMGLSRVYGWVKQLGGRIQVSSEVGKGTQFQIHLPMKKPTLSST